MGKVSKKVTKPLKLQQNGNSPNEKVNKTDSKKLHSDAILKVTAASIKKAKTTKKSDSKTQVKSKPGVAHAASKKLSKLAILNDSSELSSIATIKKNKKSAKKSLKIKQETISKEISDVIIEESPVQEIDQDEDCNVGSLLRVSNLNKLQYDREVVDTALEGVLKLQSKFETRKKQLLDGEEPIFVQISLIKVPKTPRRSIRIPLMYSTLPENPEICLITSDLKNTNIKDYNKNIDFYQDILKKNNITNIKTIIPYHQLRNDYTEFESKRRFIALHDLFLADARVKGHVLTKFMPFFGKARKMPILLKLHVNNLKVQFEKALLKTEIPIHSAGDTFMAKVGHTKMNKEHVIANIHHLIENIDANIPGGFDNIRSLNLKTSRGSAIPIYMNLKKRSEVPDVVVKGKRPKAFKKVKGELSTVLGAEVTVAPGGNVYVRNTGEMDEKDKQHYRKLKLNQEALESNIKSDDSDNEDDVVAQKEEEYLNLMEEENIAKKKKKRMVEKIEKLDENVAKKKKRKVAKIDKLDEVVVKKGKENLNDQEKLPKQKKEKIVKDKKVKKQDGVKEDKITKKVENGIKRKKERK